MTFHNAIDPIVAIIATAAAGTIASVQDVVPLKAGEVGVVALMAGAGIFLLKMFKEQNGKLIEAIEKGAGAQVEVAKAMTLLAHETTEMRKEGEEKRRQILAELAQLPEQIADRLKKTA
jgi:hypothetical protein